MMLLRFFLLQFVLLEQVEKYVVCQCTSTVCNGNDRDIQPYILEKLSQLTQVVEEKCAVAPTKEQVKKGTKC